MQTNRVRKSLLHVLMSVMMLVWTPVWAGLYDIGDQYIGAAYESDPNNNPDVIGDPADFDIWGANVGFSGSVMTVSIQTTFAGKADDGLFTRHTVPAVGIGYGDLFLGSTWSPDGSAPYKTDNASNGTIWQYGLALDDRNSAPSEAAKGNLTLYGLTSFDLNNPNRSDYLQDVRLSDEFIVNAGYRHGQEVAVNTSSQGVQALGSGTWWIMGDWVNFQIDLAGTNLMTSDEIALHWAMTCGNDVIEGSVPNLATPIPAAAWLFGSALVGLAGFARRGRKVA